MHTQLEEYLKSEGVGKISKANLKEN